MFARDLRFFMIARVDRLASAVVSLFRDRFQTNALEKFATRIERSYIVASQYRALSPAEKSVCPDLAYRPSLRSTRPSTMTAENLPGYRSWGSGADSVKERSHIPDAGRRPARTASTTPAKTAREPATQIGGINLGEGSGAPRGSIEKPTSRPATRNSTAKCWNYHAAGHFARDRREPPCVHCYRCGRAQQTMQMCPMCTENGGRNQWIRSLHLLPRPVNCLKRW